MMIAIQAPFALYAHRGFAANAAQQFADFVVLVDGCGYAGAAFNLTSPVHLRQAPQQDTAFKNSWRSGHALGLQDYSVGGLFGVLAGMHHMQALEDTLLPLSDADVVAVVQGQFPLHGV